ncbi:hypothetical protein IPG41_06625 [Candidatus Peregrinibacteria bacterium]|nr:MAG: hypothetical protein IPG41_06625 [Candidatus Peregrinibacteria bacterium]
MDAFKALTQRTKMMIVASTLFLLTLSVGVLVFGSDNLTSESSLLEQAKGSVHADMLYSTPTDAAH